MNMPRLARSRSTWPRRLRTTTCWPSSSKLGHGLDLPKTGIRVRRVARPGSLCPTSRGGCGEAVPRALRRSPLDRFSPALHADARLSPSNHRLPCPGAAGLPTSIGALDFNLGCSGYVYGLALADGLIRSGSARRVLFITSETYSKYIHPTDRSLRTIFSDGPRPPWSRPQTSRRWAVCLRHGRRGGDTLMVTQGAIRGPEFAMRPANASGGPAASTWTARSCSSSVSTSSPDGPRTPGQGRVVAGECRHLSHAPSHRVHARAPPREARSGRREAPLDLDECGNTVSSTIPILIRDLRASGRLKPGKRP